MSERIFWVLQVFYLLFQMLYEQQSNLRSDQISRSVMSDSLRPHELQPTRFLCPCNSPGKNTGVGCHSLLQAIIPTQESNPGLLHCRQILYHLNQQMISVQNLTLSLPSLSLQERDRACVWEELGLPLSFCNFSVKERNRRERRRERNNYILANILFLNNHRGISLVEILLSDMLRD